VRFVDRTGALLREVRADDATRARFLPLDEMGEHLPAAVLAAEDARFFQHPGVDPVAVIRAAFDNVRHRRVVSGASTLTMQLARLVRPHPRTLFGKLSEMALALRIEASLSKREILEQYVNRAPFGRSLRGAAAATQFYLGKAPASLSLAEAAAIAGIPRGPAVYDWPKHPERVLRRRDRILERAEKAGLAPREACERARAEPLAVPTLRGSFGAPHFVQALRAGTTALDAAARDALARAREVHTTLDRGLQSEIEAATLSVLAPLAPRHVTAGAVVVVDNASGDVLAYVGSPDFFDERRSGQNDGVRARRQPGSTLKPFVYGLAMERLGYTAATALPDVELALRVPGGTYRPMNYDEKFHGPVRLREALANSFNVPAVFAADAVGIERVLERLHELGFGSLTESPQHYGPALALGDGEVTLLELAAAYATLARGGVFKPLRAVRSVASGSESAARREAPERPASSEEAVFVRVMPADVAAALTDILRDRHARRAAFGEHSALDLPFDVAAKTGTSKAYRDNWTVGYTREVTVAVWVGNFDGSSMQGVSGITGAAPLFRAAMEAAMRGRTASALVLDVGFEEVEVCALSGGAKSPACPHAVRERVPNDRAALPPCTMHERIAVDRRTGLRASRRCPAAQVEVRTFERYDPRYLAWARAAHRPLAPDADSPLCPGGAHEAGAGDLDELRIAYPRDGARFLLDPDRARAHQRVAVRIEAPAGTRSVRLRVDGHAEGASTSPYVVPWTLAPGEHTLVAETDGGRQSAPVRVRVD
jgi:penicillin-binding protein 1C